MAELQSEHCVVCRSDSPFVSDTETEALMPQISTWTLAVDDGVRKLRRVFRFRRYRDALEFTSAVGAVADAEGHHPLLVTEWGSVTVVWWTHAIKNLHRNDFVMASKTDALFEQSTPA